MRSLDDDIPRRLRDLPRESQPPYDWLEFRRRARSRAPERSAVRWEHAAAAAGITVLVASMAMWGRADHHTPNVASSGVATAPLAASNGVASNVEPAHVSLPKPQSQPDPRDDVHRSAATTAAEVPSALSIAVQAAVASQLAGFTRTQASRRWLDAQPAEPTVVRMGPRLAVANLEDRIAWVDDALTDAHFAQMNAGRMQALQQQRARLVTSLAQVRYAETLVAQVP